MSRSDTHGNVYRKSLTVRSRSAEKPGAWSLDRSEGERRGAEHPADQPESEGSRALRIGEV